MRKNNTVTHLKTAILVDGGFYRRRAQSVFGDKTAEERAVELTNYCKRHLNTHGKIMICIEFSIMTVLLPRSVSITLF